MGPGYFVIAILGCADGSVNCTPVMTVPTRYESEAVCAAAAPAALLANSDFDFPSLFAECRPGTARAAESDGKAAASGEARRG
ncbi:MAG TPA: hypothetical protein VFP53_05500 [Sphingomicrobium sp.]|nr:hypothetical protein [Sphingomicrobium sp.]